MRNELKQILRITGLASYLLIGCVLYSFADNTLATSSGPDEVQQSGKRITGLVTDIKGEPIIGANILEKGTANGTVTDIDGKFELTVSGTATVQISYIGYISQEVNLSTIGGG
ncbi:MAG: carboxypeptidase-like regulatory domain-containing protein [Tannerella sp.]|nr:carboxypeptidase-like regulatory domain-containing protein [Tannerella sp.]